MKFFSTNDHLQRAGCKMQNQAAKINPSSLPGCHFLTLEKKPAVNCQLPGGVLLAEVSELHGEKKKSLKTCKNSKARRKIDRFVPKSVGSITAYLMIKVMLFF